ncbi:MAG: I78 family peptidase inhibitor [Luteimonas sp.]
MPARRTHSSLALSVAALLMLSLAACAPKKQVVADVAPVAPADTSSSSTTPTPAEQANPVIPADTAALCNADAAQSFVGKQASEDTVAQAQRAAAARGDVRVIKPGQAVTMDYRNDRLNVEVDEQGKIIKITCG